MADLLVGVWDGNFDGSPNRHLVGRDLAGPLLFDILDAVAMELRPAEEAAPPPELKRIEVCPLSGQSVSRWCPHRKQGWIIPGVSPIQTCRLHKPISIAPASGLRKCPEDEAGGGQRLFWFVDDIGGGGGGGGLGVLHCDRFSRKPTPTWLLSELRGLFLLNYFH